MRHQIRNILVGAILLAIFCGFALPVARGAQGEEHRRVALTPAWTTGIISRWAGVANIVVDDLDLDGLVDIVACSYASVYIVNRFGDTYDVARYSEGVSCQKIAVGDRDGNGLQEIYVAGIWSGWPVPQVTLHVLRSDTLEQIDEFAIPANSYVEDLAVGDVDADGAQEIVVIQSDATYVYDANTHVLEWAATDKGGDRVGLGDVDGDQDVEIVVNGATAHILNARLQKEEFAYAGGFGPDMAVGDVDADGIAEIAAVDGSDLYVFEADTGTNKWLKYVGNGISRLAVADMDGDGSGEVVTGDSAWGYLSGYAGSNGSRLWMIGNPEYGVDGLALGDTDNDDVPEVVWGAGRATTARNALLIGDWQSESVEWASDDLEGPLMTMAADVDLDNQTEIILASYATDSRYENGLIRVYDGATHEVEWSTVIDTGSGNEWIHALDVGQVDGDPALEIVLGCEVGYNTRIQVYDGITHLLEWQSGVLDSDGPLRLLVSNVDTDPTEEVVISLPNRRVQVWDVPTSTCLWDSENLSNDVQDIDVRDIDGDTTPELAILTTATLYVFEPGTWDLEANLPFPNAQSMALANNDLSGPGEVLVLTQDSETWLMLQALDGVDYATLWQWPVPAEGLTRVRAMEMDGDGDEEFVVIGGNDWPYVPEPSLLLIGSHLGPGTWAEYQVDKNWGQIHSVTLADVDNDTQPELLFGSNRCIQVNEISSSPLVIHSSYLPFIWR